MQNSFMAQAAQACVTVHNFNFFSDHDISKDWKKGEDSRKSGFSVNDEERHMIHFEPIGQITDTRSTLVGMCDDDDLMAAIDELGGELIDVAFNAAGLGEEEVADHGDVVRHLDWSNIVPRGLRLPA